MHQRGLGMAMTIETEAMEARLDADLDVRRRAAMAMQAAIEPAPVGVVMMAGQAVDLRMFAMLEVQGQHLCVIHQGSRSARLVRAAMSVLMASSVIAMTPTMSVE